MLNAIMEAREAATVAQIRKAAAQPATRVYGQLAERGAKTP